MFLSLVRKEIANNVLSLRFIITFALFVALVLLSLFMLTSTYETARHNYEISRSSHLETLRAIEGREDQDQRFHDTVIEGDGLHGDRPPQPLSVFVYGLEANLPLQVTAGLWGSHTTNQAYYRNPLFVLSATPDFGYIVNIVVSLLSLLFVFDAICGEKERGTLKLVLANAVPRDLVLLSKWVGGYISLIVPFLVAVLGGMTYVYATGAIGISGDTLERLVWLVGLSLLYISLFFGLGMLISARTHRSSTALVVALFVWVCWVLVIPNLSPVVARVLSPVPTFQKINAEKGAIRRETEIRLKRVNRNMLRYGKKAMAISEKIREEGESEIRKLERFYQDQLGGQIELSKNLARLSPSASFTFALADMAHTGSGLFSAFRHSFRRFEKEYREWGRDWHDRFHRNAGKELEDGWFELDLIPSLKPVQIRLDDTIDAVLMDVLLLGVLNILFFMLSYLFFLRYDVT